MIERRKGRRSERPELFATERPPHLVLRFAIILSSALALASALILVVEDRWAQLLSDAAREGGGRIVGGERIPRHRIAQSLRSAGYRSGDTTQEGD